MEYVYAGLLLHKLGKPVTEDSLKKVISAAGVEVDEAKVKVLIASLNGIDIDAELANASAIAAAPVETQAEKKEVKKEEKEAESAAGLSSLFG